MFQARSNMGVEIKNIGKIGKFENPAGTAVRIKSVLDEMQKKS
jgi:hypothetical protein